jgi:hypothetical protein
MRNSLLLAVVCISFAFSSKSVAQSTDTCSIPPALLAHKELDQGGRMIVLTADQQIHVLENAKQSASVH